MHTFLKAGATGLALILAWLPGEAAPTDQVNPRFLKPPVRVACVGDSITEGFGAEKGKSYPSQLQEILGQDWQVKNFGVGGRTLLHKGDFPYWKESAFQAAQDFQPDVVIIMLGTNDTKPQNWVHHEDFYADYQEMVRTFKNLASKPRIYLCRPCPGPGPGSVGINEENVQIEIPLIDRLAAQESTGLIDMHAALVAKPELLPDHVHPNTAGAKIMAQTAADALKGNAP